MAFEQSLGHWDAGRDQHDHQRGQPGDAFVRSAWNGQADDVKAFRSGKETEKAADSPRLLFCAITATRASALRQASGQAARVNTLSGAFSSWRSFSWQLFWQVSFSSLPFWRLSFLPLWMRPLSPSITGEETVIGRSGESDLPLTFWPRSPSCL